MRIAEEINTIYFINVFVILPFFCANYLGRQGVANHTLFKGSPC